MTTRCLLLTTTEQHPGDRKVWGTGGWTDPVEREALDWFTLLRFLGWQPVLAYGDAPPASVSGFERVVVACERAVLHPRWASALEGLARSGALVVVRVAVASGGGASLTPASAGRKLSWRGPGTPRDWACRSDVSVYDLAVEAEDEIWGYVGGNPAVIARRMGAGAFVTLAFHPSRARDEDGAATALLRSVLAQGSARVTATLDFRNTMVLRMDDPGGAQNVHSRSWTYSKLRGEQWREIASYLERVRGRITIAYVPGWVDDGDALRGRLTVNGAPAPRIAGLVHPTPVVVYEPSQSDAPPSDYVTEYLAIQELRKSGLGDVELHGYTHIHPDREAWAAADDRYDNVDWYRELGAGASSVLEALPGRDHPLHAGVAAVEEWFGTRPTTLIPPGDEWTDDTLARALDEGLEIVDSYYMAIRDGDRFCWTTHVCSPYLDLADSAWFSSELPVVGYIHDYEPSVHGTGWLTGWLDRWRQAGALRVMDMRELARTLRCRIGITDKGGGSLVLHLSAEGGDGGPGTIGIVIDSPTPLPGAVEIRSSTGHTRRVPLELEDDRRGRVTVSTSAAGPPGG